MGRNFVLVLRVYRFFVRYFRVELRWEWYRGGCIIFFEIWF